MSKQVEMAAVAKSEGAEVGVETTVQEASAPAVDRGLVESLVRLQVGPGVDSLQTSPRWECSTLTDARSLSPPHQCHLATFPCQILPMNRRGASVAPHRLVHHGSWCHCSQSPQVRARWRSSSAGLIYPHRLLPSRGDVLLALNRT